jgi:hypothetical protein
MKLTKAEIKEILKNNTTVEVTFTKVNGEQRVMNCTLHESVIPKSELPLEASKKSQNDSIVSVWDITQNGWRSFRVDNLVSIKK